MNSNDLKKTSKTYEVGVVKESVTSLKSGTKAVSIGVLDGFADTPPSAYHRGVDIGLIEYETGIDGELPSGSYTVRLTSREEIRERGHHPAMVEFVDADGEVASRQRIDVDVFSPEVPEQRAFDQAVFSLESRFTDGMAGRHTPEFIVIVFWCSNGSHGIIVLA